MRTFARVHDVRQGRARLTCDAATSGCEACGAGRGCALRVFPRMGSPTLAVPEQWPDGTRLVAGAGVEIEIDDGELLRAAALAYLPPLAGLLGGPVLARALGGADGAAVLAAAVGMALGWGVSRVWLRRAPPRYRLHPAEHR